MPLRTHAPKARKLQYRLISYELRFRKEEKRSGRAGRHGPHSVQEETYGEVEKSACAFCQTSWINEPLQDQAALIRLPLGLGSKFLHSYHSISKCLTHKPDPFGESGHPATVSILKLD